MNINKNQRFQVAAGEFTCRHWTPMYRNVVGTEIVDLPLFFQWNPNVFANWNSWNFHGTPFAETVGNRYTYSYFCGPEGSQGVTKVRRLKKSLPPLPDPRNAKVAIGVTISHCFRTWWTSGFCLREINQKECLVYFLQLLMYSDGRARSRKSMLSLCFSYGFTTFWRLGELLHFVFAK